MIGGLDVDFSYRILNETETNELKQQFLDASKALAKKYHDLYCQQYKIDADNKNLLKSLWYIVFFSNAYGEDIEQNLNYVLEKCPTPASVRSFVYRLSKKYENTSSAQ